MPDRHYWLPFAAGFACAGLVWWLIAEVLL